jgi:hypothetical protein
MYVYGVLLLLLLVLVLLLLLLLLRLPTNLPQGHLAPGDGKVCMYGVAEARRECRGAFRVFLDAERPRGGGEWQLVIRRGVGLRSALQRFNCCAEYSNARIAAAGFWCCLARFSFPSPLLALLAVAALITLIPAAVTPHSVAPSLACFLMC